MYGAAKARAASLDSSHTTMWEALSLTILSSSFNLPHAETVGVRDSVQFNFCRMAVMQRSKYESTSQWAMTPMSGVGLPALWLTQQHYMSFLWSPAMLSTSINLFLIATEWQLSITCLSLPLHYKLSDSRELVISIPLSPLPGIEGVFYECLLSENECLDN